MPTVHRLPNARIEIRARDHGPPDCHVVLSDGRDVLVELADLAVKGRIEAHQLRESLAWITEHQQELMQKWQEMNP